MLPVDKEVLVSEEIECYSILFCFNLLRVEMVLCDKAKRYVFI